MALWKKTADITTANATMTHMCHHLGIKLTDIGPDYITATLPVDKRTQQPMGLLHGGASVALAETLGSLAGNLACDNGEYCVGLEINANHLRPVSSGRVTGTARAIHIGKTTQVWDIKIENEQYQTVCISRITLAVKKPRQA
ncbi:hotdog fold thioesterase [Endozoicomonas sp.]|nr:hotdog fold thioesterase [Endozoicomonas sp.]